MADLLGMRGTGSWTNEERPKNFREGYLFLYPNGDMPLTGMTSKLSSEKVDDPEFKYYSKNLQAQGGAFTATEVYNHSDLASGNKVTGTAASGTVYYVKVTAAVVKHFRAGHTVLLLASTNDAQYTFGKVTGRSANGNSSWVSLVALATGTGSLEAYNYIDIVGNANAEGDVSKDPISYAADKYTNYTQIFRTSLDITRTQLNTKMRIGDVYKTAREEAFLYHGIEMEMAFMRGMKTENDGDNGQKERTTQGFLPFLVENNSSNILNYTTGTSLNWLQGGEDWIDDSLEVLFRKGSSQRIGFCGSGAMLGIMKLVKHIGQFSLTVDTIAYGIKVMRWVTPLGEIMLKRHPLFTHKTYSTNSIALFDPANVKYRFITDTTFFPDPRAKEGGYNKIDGIKEEYLTECGIEWHFPETMMYLQGVGTNGTA